MVPRLSRKAVVVGISLAGAVLPFDLSVVIWSFRDHNVRPIHAVVLVFLAGAALPTGSVVRGSKSHFAESLGSSVFDRLVLALAGLLVLSTVFADQYQTMATVSLRRLLTGLALAVVVRRAAQRESDVRLILSGLVFGGTLACVLGFYLLAGLPGSEIGEWFRGRTVMFGPTQRLTLPFPHANVAGVYLGASLILALGLLVDSRRQSASLNWRAPLFGLCSLILGAGLILTLSRSAALATVVALIVALVVSMAVSMAVTNCSRVGQTTRTRANLVIASAVVLLLGTMAASPSWRLRIADPHNAYWYETEILAPQSVDPDAPPEPVLVRNQSEAPWPRSRAGEGLVAISLDNSGAEIGRSLFPLPELAPSTDNPVLDGGPDNPVLDGGPDNPVLINVSGLVVTDETAAIVWDVFRPEEGHFRGLSGQPVVTSSVSGSALPPIVEQGKPFRPGRFGVDPVPARTQLWSAARTLTLQRPLVGVGPGNFRLRYQEVLGVSGPQTSHAHSILFEPLASWGIPAAAIFLFLILLTGLRVLRATYDEPLNTVVLAALLSVVVANLADWTLASTSAGLLFWLLLGLGARVSDRPGTISYES